MRAPRIALGLALLAITGFSVAEAGRPGFGLADLRRRVLGETATAGGDAANRPIFGGGGGVVGGGWGGYRGGCFGGACNDRQGIVSTLAVLNAQDAVRQASDSYGFAGPYYASQSAQRSAVAAAWGQLPYLANQQTWDGSAYWGRR